MAFVSGETTVTRRDDMLEGPRFTAHNVAPQQSFTMELLESADPQLLRYDGETITLDVDNGRWIWRVVGVDNQARLVHGQWPD